jgi:AbrB family looped-hinge helix DNA binding protein
MLTVKVSEKNQIAVPAEARRKLGIKPGDRLIVEVRGNHILLLPEPVDYANALAGLHADIWEGVDPAEYIRGERQAWRG